MKYIARCKKTLYYDWSADKFGNSRKKMAAALSSEDLFNNRIILVSKKDQLAVIEDLPENRLKLNILAGKSFEINLDTAQQYFELIYLDDTCFETKQKLLKKMGK
jgi:uncharacterized protein YabE (DUF348 family)